MTDIIHKLRDQLRWWTDDNPSDRKEAADEIERLREALTPSGATKAAYCDEFTFPICIGDDDGEDIHNIVTVPWTTIKEIMAAILARAELEYKNE